MTKFYVTRWKRKYDGCNFNKIKQSLRSFHFDDFESALNFFKRVDSAVYCANLKSFDDVLKKVVVLESV